MDLINLDKISRNNHAFFLAYDQGLEHGPTDFNDESVNPENIIKIAASGFFTGLIVQKGIAEKYPPVNVPLILKLNGKTKLAVDEPMAEQICTVDEAIKLGAAAVGYTIYLGSEFEEKMMKEFAAIEMQAHEKNLPVMVWMYPRGSAVPNPDSPETIAYAARVGLEIGADLVKVHFPNFPDEKSLAWIVKSAGRCRVVFAGGGKLPEAEFLGAAKLALTSGTFGLAVGRNIWQSPDPLAISEKLSHIVLSS